MKPSLIGTDAASAGLVLRTTPPRAPRNQLARTRLGLGDAQFRDHAVLVVQAPPGFGKTSLLGQWRREHLARGAAVAWLVADDRDTPAAFLNALLAAVRIGCGRPGFGRGLLESLPPSVGELEGFTAWLAEVAQSSLDTVLTIDEADRLSEDCLAALNYLLHNLPPNLRVIVAARGGLDDAVADLDAYGLARMVPAETLRFRLEETIALVRNRFGNKVDTDACARLHELTEGWPLGLQLTLAAVERSGEPRDAINAMLDRGGSHNDRLVGGLLDNLAADDLAFLRRVAIVDMLHPDLCRVLCGAEDAPERLARLVRETPIFFVGDNSEWCRLHALAKDALRARQAELPPEESVALHRRAMDWLAAHGLLQEAAQHAHAAGQQALAFDLAERCLYDAMQQGNHIAVLDWLDRLPAEELHRRPRLRLAAAWALALSERHAEAGNLVARILETADVDLRLRYECALILSGAAYYADDPDRCVALFEPWFNESPALEPRLQQSHANRQAMVAILRGDPASARRYLQGTVRGAFDKGLAYAARWGDCVAGLSYVWEGQVQLAESVMRPALTSADADLGRRSPLACMLAALLATAIYERDRPDEAAALLANRLDVLEKVGTPETILLAYRTAARVASAQGVEHRALDLLEALHAVGVARQLPRLCVASLGEQIRLHAARFRSETCRSLAVRIDEICAASERTDAPIWQRGVALVRVIANAHVAIAAQDWRRSLEILNGAGELADAMKLGRVRIKIMALRALALDRLSEDGRPLLREAMNLAQTFGLTRTFADGHPILADWVRRLVDEEAGAAARVAPAIHLRPAGDVAAPPRAVPSMVLTPKEREVLELLARNLSNKEIALAMSVGEETVKWHLKNLFGKLDAGTRKHVVRRAQLLGLLEGG